ncbi:hypothetical protein HRI_002241900 [Hibiscus trionum]|uniref:CCHC-type domain-containing protein n=1 Tax=Hibiscus trionum TaxID=183268 RepID=A0A9W7HYK4_HIBTR|nr:hypothetical protein HRI_002241900 [Hibiscus trionum]
MDADLASLSIDDGEEEALEIPTEIGEVVDEYELCLIGRFLTSSVIHFLAMRNTLVDLWRPLGGISITDLGEKRICFRFYHEVDMLRVLEGCPWFFNNHLLILHRIEKGEDPMLVSLDTAMFWVQVHDIPTGLISEPMVRQFGNFIGQFLDYDSKLVLTSRRHFMRIKVAINVNYSLKRKKKIGLGKDKSVYVQFQYEKLSLFCFICGKLGHGESYCPIRLSVDPKDIKFGWDLSIRAPVRRGPPAPSNWLREEVTGTSLAEINAVTQVHGQLRGTFKLPDVARQSQNARGHLYTSTGLGNLITGTEEDEHMEPGSDAEDNPLSIQDGKKRQRVIGEAASVSGNMDSAAPNKTHDISAGSACQGSREP